MYSMRVDHTARGIRFADYNRPDWLVAVRLLVPFALMTHSVSFAPDLYEHGAKSVESGTRKQIQWRLE